jgi:hypothetical protein
VRAPEYTERVPGFLSSPGAPSSPHPPLGPRGETHSLAAEGGGGTQLRRWGRQSGTLGMYNPSTVRVVESQRPFTLLRNDKTL